MSEFRYDPMRQVSPESLQWGAGQYGAPGATFNVDQPFSAAAAPAMMMAGMQDGLAIDMSSWGKTLAADGINSAVPLAAAQAQQGIAGGFGAAQPQGFMGKAGNWLQQPGNLQGVASGIGALTQAWLGFQQMKNAKDALGFQKEAFNANLNNSIQSYNTSLEDRIRGRSADPNENDVQAYLARHSLKR